MATLGKHATTSLLVVTLMTSLATPSFAQSSSIDFGDDSSQWSNDGECDDPRFIGEDMAKELEDIDILKDATDCKTLFDAGKISLKDSDEASAVEEADSSGAIARAQALSDDEIDFGDDTSDFANDGECDDPRFSGDNMSSILLPEDEGRDASDCRAAYEAGEITFGAAPAQSSAAEIDFGDDSSEWSKDFECDDPRFVGPGMGGELLQANEMRDASDCRLAYEQGSIRLAGEADAAEPSYASSPVSSASLEAIARRIDFGDDSGEWPHDGECDDPDFFGPGSSNSDSSDQRLKDASDCRAAFVAGTVSFKTNTQLDVVFDFGDDTSRWANDGECDDPRFYGNNLNKKMLLEDILSDATDCQALFDKGEVNIKPIYTPEYILGAPYDTSGVDFGDDSSSYANDSQCDDPRFEGPAVAATVFDSDIRADASDCKAAFEAGRAALIDSYD